MRIAPLSISKLATLALILLPIAAPAAAQTPADLYYGPLEARLAGGATLEDVVDTMESGLTDIIPAPLPAACSPIPSGGIAGVTSNHFYYLSEILPAGVGLNNPFCGAWLGCFLDAVPGTIHDHSTLVIDRECRVERTLVVPDRFVLAGTGLDGAGRLSFDLPAGGRALRFKAPSASGAADTRHSKIRDLSIGNVTTNGQVAIDLSNSTMVEIDSVRIADFAFGVVGRFSLFNTIESSNLSNNGVGIRPGFDSTTWQINENSIGQSRFTGIALHPTHRAAVISGNVIENNLRTGILVQGFANVIQSNWFEGNGSAAAGFAIVVPATTEDTRILNNLFSINDISDAGIGSIRCFNSHPASVLIADTCNI